MRMRLFRNAVCAAVFCLFISGGVYAYTPEHHLINMGRDVLNILASPVKGVFLKGPADVSAMYQAEVYGREKPEKRGKFRYRMFALWSAPAVECKAIIDGLVDCGRFTGKFFKELLSIPFSD